MCDQWIEKIPVVSESAAVAIFILNIIFPGVGTMVLACLGPSGNVGDQLLVGILQLLLFAFCFIGIFWSIWWSVLVFQKAGNHQQVVQSQQGVNINNNYPLNNYGNQYPPNNLVYIPSQSNNIQPYSNQPQYNNQPLYNNQPQYSVVQPQYNNQPQYSVVQPQFNNQPQYMNQPQYTNQSQYTNPSQPQYINQPQYTNQPLYNVVQPQYNNQPQNNYQIQPNNQPAAVNIQQGAYVMNNQPNTFEQR